MKYRTIVADPPWAYPRGFATQSRTVGKWDGPVGTKSLPYPSMTLSQICALPVHDLAAKDSRLFLWATNRYLPHSFEVLRAWGFAYRQALVWHKSDGNMGGGVAPNSAEFLLVGTRGAVKRLGRMPSAVISTSAPKRHSTKPACFMDYIEQVSPGPRLELFARSNRLGWDTWGNESLEHVSVGTANGRAGGRDAMATDAPGPESPLAEDGGERTAVDDYAETEWSGL